MAPIRRFALVFGLSLAALGATTSVASAGTLSVSIAGAGAVVGGPIDCVRAAGAGQTGDCSATAPPEVALSAKPARGFAFDHWGGVCQGDKPDCDIIVPKIGSVAATATFVDIEDPSVKLESPAAGPLAGTTSVEAVANDNVAIDRVEFSVRGVVKLVDPSAPYGGTFNTATIADGSANFTATAYDVAGNVASASRVALIDNTNPQLGVKGPDEEPFPTGSTQAWTITAADAGSGLAQVRCSLVALGSPPVFGTCSGGTTAHSVTGKPEGFYALTVRASDVAGNVSDATRRFKIDATAPETTIAAGIPDGTSTTETSLTWALEASEPNATFECRVYPAALTPGGFTPCNGGASHTASGFAPGTYSFESRATDLVGNVDATPVKRTFTIAAPSAIPAPVVLAPPTAAAGAKIADQIVVTLGFSFTSTKKKTKLSGLVVKNIPAGSTVTVRCPKGCAKKTFKKSRAGGQLALKSLTKKPLPVNTAITVVVSKAGASSAVKILKIRARQAPLVTTLCQPEGAAKPGAC